MPTSHTARLVAAATAAILCFGSPLAASAVAATHHKRHHVKKVKPLTVAVARSAAIASAAPLILDPADQVGVTGCTKLSSTSYQCALRLQAASSNSVCNWTVVVSMTQTGPDVTDYSHVDCAG